MQFVDLDILLQAPSQLFLQVFVVKLFSILGGIATATAKFVWLNVSVVFAISFELFLCILVSKSHISDLFDQCFLFAEVADEVDFNDLFTWILNSHRLKQFEYHLFSLRLTQTFVDSMNSLSALLNGEVVGFSLLFFLECLLEVLDFTFKHVDE